MRHNVKIKSRYLPPGHVEFRNSEVVLSQLRLEDIRSVLNWYLDLSGETEFVLKSEYSMLKFDPEDRKNVESIEIWPHSDFEDFLNA